MNKLDELQVCGLFAAKYVFDALGLLVIDVFIVSSELLFFLSSEKTKENILNWMSYSISSCTSL